VTDVTAEPLREALRPPGPVRFGMQEYRAAGIITMAVQGELDLLTAPKLAGRIGELLRAEPGDVVLDLGETEFIDSAGLSILLNVQRRLERRGGQLRVICDEGPVRRVIELARLEETLGVVPASVPR
jgi:anti-sigma B factor antagonist